MYDAINQGFLSTTEDSESEPLRGGNESLQNPEIILRPFSGANSGSAAEESQETDRRISENEPVNRQSLLYLDDVSPITCSTLLSKYTEDFSDLIPFNIKLAFMFYCVIPIFVYIKWGLNYSLKWEFFVELTKKQQALLVGPMFAFLFDMTSFMSITTAVFPLIMVLFSSPNDFLLSGEHVVRNMPCVCCWENTPSVKEDMLKHLEKLQQKIYDLASWLIEVHKSWIKEPIKCCTH